MKRNLTEKRNSRTLIRKPAGTRIGLLSDWRSAGMLGKSSCRQRHVLRDGR